MTGFSHCDTKPTQQRQIPRKRRSMSGIYVFRGERAIPYESALERDFIIRTEFFLKVTDIIAQPVTVRFTSENGRSYIYTPDFLLYHRIENRENLQCSKPILVEVKPWDSLQQNWRKWSRKWKAARHYAREQGWQFRIMDESRIRDESLQNIRWLARFKKTEIDEKRRKKITDEIIKLGYAEFDYLLKRHFGKNDFASGAQNLWALLAQRYIDCDVSLPLDGATKFWVPTDG